MPADPTAEVRVLDTYEGVDLLRRAAGWGRGFLGVDPVTQNSTLMVRLLTEAEAETYQVAAHGSAVAVAGCVRNPANRHQALVAIAELPSAGPDGAPADADPRRPAASASPAELAKVIRRFLTYLSTHRDITSFVAHAVVGDGALPGLIDSGFCEVGRLREHVYRSGGFHDEHVFFARLAKVLESSGADPSSGAEREREWERERGEPS